MGDSASRLSPGDRWRPAAEVLNGYLESKKAARGKGLGIGLKKLVPPGTD